MFSSISIEKLRAPMGALCLIAFVGLACKLSSLTGTKMNMFESATAQDGAGKIKAKMGSDNPKVSRMEIHEDRLEITSHLRFDFPRTVLRGGAFEHIHL